MEICVANCKNGNPCQWPVLPGSSYCFNHDPRPEIAVRRREGRKRGGIMHRQYLSKPPIPVKLDTLEDIRDLTFRVRRMTKPLVTTHSTGVLSVSVVSGPLWRVQGPEARPFREDLFDEADRRAGRDAE